MDTLGPEIITGFAISGPDFVMAADSRFIPSTNAEGTSYAWIAFITQE